jgi:radical SAM protein with 4Fe4S-binding SPASM domain
MPSHVRHLVRYARAGAHVLRTTIGRPAVPLKLNWCLTYWCQYRCKTCNIWQLKPTDELTTDEVLAFVRANPGVPWVDLTGGEIFLRKDVLEILDAVVGTWTRLAFLHFPTNGFLTDRIIEAARLIANRGPAQTVITVSLDGDEALNDEVRGIKGGFRRQVETFRALRAVPGIRVVFGMTLSSYNLGRFEETFRACQRECPGLEIHDFHLNVAQVSAHYYGNDQSPGVVPDRERARHEVRTYRSLRGAPLSPAAWVEDRYLHHLDGFLEHGHTPMRCHSLRASCFVDPWGAVYPCITYARPVGRLREHGMRLAPIWSGDEARRLQREIWDGRCPQCWTACEAYQSIMGNALVPGRTWPPPQPVRSPA